MVRPARFLPAYQPIEAYRGDDLGVPWVFTRTVNNVKGPRNVSNEVFTSQVRYGPEIEPALADFTMDDTHSVTGLIVARLARAVMQLLPSQTLYYDLSRIVDNETKTLVAGPFTPFPDITRP